MATELSGRSAAERRVDTLAAEARELRSIEHPNVRQRDRLFTVEQKLAKAWRVVHEMREGRR